MRQKEALAAVQMSVEEVLGPQTTPERSDMLFDFVNTDDVIIEVEEVHEEAGMDARMFGSTREDISSEFAEMNMFNFHAECPMPSAAQFRSMATTAEEKFDTLLRQSMSDGANIRKQLLNRLAFRFSEVIDFVLSTRRNNVCQQPKLRCYDLDAVFGNSEVTSLEVLIAHSTELVEQLERQCPRVLFATYYMTLDGKTDRLL